MKAYADLGGRVFASHWHNVWIGGAYKSAATQKPAVWSNIATWTGGTNLDTNLVDLIDEVQNPKGTSFATGCSTRVMGSTVRDEIQIQDMTGRTTCSGIDAARAQRWTYVKGSGGAAAELPVRHAQRGTAQPGVRQGRVLRHARLGWPDRRISPTRTAAPPEACVTALTPQEKALIFMLFDLASCAGGTIG